MQVELFTLPELDQSADDINRRTELLSQLDLPAQVKVQTLRWPILDVVARNVYRALCPETTALKSYDLDPIPLRVLELAALAQPEFAELTVWHPRTGAQTDPVLIARRQADWNAPEYILARWGEVLEDFNTLKLKAAKLIRGNTIATVSKEIHDRELTLKLIRELDDETLLSRYTGNSWSPLG